MSSPSTDGSRNRVAAVGLPDRAERCDVLSPRREFYYHCYYACVPGWWLHARSECPIDLT